MSFQQIHKGGTFGPNMSFPAYCLFENCTFYAQCKFEEGSIFRNCTFLKCCPKPYSNPNSIVKKAILENCSLEYITIDSESLVVNCNKGLRAIVQSKENPKELQIGSSKTKECICGQPAIDGCKNDGISISPTQEGESKVSNLATSPCEGDKVLGFTTSKAR